MERNVGILPRHLHSGISARILGVAVLLGAIMFMAQPVTAETGSKPQNQQSAPAAASQTLAPSASVEDMKALLATLQDPVARQKLIDQIQVLITLRQQAAAAAPPVQPAVTTSAEASGSPGVQAIEATSDQIRRVSDALVSGAALILDFPTLLNRVERQLGDEATRLAWLMIALKLAAILGAAFAAEQAARFLLRRARRSVGDREHSALWLRLLLLLSRMAIDLLQIAVFGAAAYIVLPLTNPGDFVRTVALAFVNANVIVRAVLTFGRGLLAPEEGSTLQLLRVKPETAGYWFVWLRRITGLAVYGYAFATVALLLGLPQAGYDILVKALGFCLAALFVLLIFQNRMPMAAWIRGRSETTRMPPALRILRARVADVWHVLTALYVIGIFGVWAAQVPGGFEFITRASLISILVVVAVRMLAGGGDGLLRRFFSIGEELKHRFPGLEARADRYLPILLTLLHAALYGLAAFVLAQAWGFGAFDWLRSDLGRQIVGDAATVAITVVVAVAIWEGVSLAMEYYLLRQTADGRRRLRYGRARTLLPLMRRTVAIVLIIFVVLIGLSELGVNIAPLLAGAGVVGIAVGFGAQSFVKDLINGLNLLLEDTVGVGDTVTIGSGTGEVEAISMRTIRLRDGVGAVHTIPFSEVSRVINSSRDFGRAVFDIPIGLAEDFERMVDILKKTATELQADPAAAPSIVAPATTPTLDRFTDYAMILHMEIKTLPGKQSEVARQFNRRLKARLDELGIAMPIPARRLYMGDKDEAAASEAQPPRKVRHA
jgi:small-conductance mechanosensitive channel